jgi:hypothetical protein
MRIRLSSKNLILFILCSQVSAGFSVVFAHDSGPQDEAGQPAQTNPKPAKTPVLEGHVHHNAGQGNAGVELDPNQVQVQTKGDPGLQKVSGSFFGRKKMSAEDYRNLNYGVLGIVTQKSILGSKQTVIDVITDCPAALAGIRPGDVELGVDDHAWTREDNQRETWNRADGEAGTPVDVIIRRGRQTMTFHLIRMNIEDIKNSGIRHRYERMLRKMGPPSWVKHEN